MANLTREEVISASIIKAVVIAIIIPVVLFFMMFVIDENNAVGAVASWYAFSILLYKFKKDKQLTAYFFFKIIKVIALFAVAYVGFIVLMILIMHVSPYGINV